jgi:hypothetical protein
MAVRSRGIRIHDATRKRLKEKMAYGDTLDGIINALIDCVDWSAKVWGVKLEHFKK